MSRQTPVCDKTMKRTALKLLQVSAAYFALGTTAMPTLGHVAGLGPHSPLLAHRFAAGAWPMIGLPTPSPRKRTAHEGGRMHPLQVAANDNEI